MAKMKFTSIEEYISAAPKECRPLLKKIRAEIATRVPAAEEAISYNIPAFKTSSVFIFFAAFKKHIGIYPPLKDKKLQKRLKLFMNEKGNLSFPLDQEMPIKLIGNIAVALERQLQAKQ